MSVASGTFTACNVRRRGLYDCKRRLGDTMELVSAPALVPRHGMWGECCLFVVLLQFGRVCVVFAKIIFCGEIFFGGNIIL